MPIEQQQIGDKQIMDATRVESQPASGRIRFCTKLPSGKDINSEWIQESNKTKGVLLWCEAVRQKIVEEDKEERAITRRKLQEQAAARTAAPDLSTTTHFPTATSSNTPAGLSSLSDPAAFLSAALKQAEIDEQHWRGAALSAVANWEKAKADLAKWRSISSSLSPPPAAATPSPTSSGQSATAASPGGSGTGENGIASTIDFSDMDEDV